MFSHTAGRNAPPRWLTKPPAGESGQSRRSPLQPPRMLRAYQRTGHSERSGSDVHHTVHTSPHILYRVPGALALPFLSLPCPLLALHICLSCICLLCPTSRIFTHHPSFACFPRGAYRRGFMSHAVYRSVRRPLWPHRCPRACSVHRSISPVLPSGLVRFQVLGVLLLYYS